MTQTLRNHLQALQIPHHAADWLAMLWEAIQAFDDFADGDAVNREQLDSVIWGTLVAMPANPFFAQHAQILLPVVGTMVLKWQASDRVEREGKASAQSYMWRAGFYDVILCVFQLVYGAKVAAENAHIVLGLYGETLEEYKQEFQNA